MAEKTPPHEPPQGADSGDRLSIEQLATLTGLTVRTVRYYIQQGLVDRPEGAKRGAFYQQRHVKELLMLRRWSDAGLSLDRIRALRGGAAEDAPPKIEPMPGHLSADAATGWWGRCIESKSIRLLREPKMNEFDAATMDDDGGFSLRGKRCGDTPPVLVGAEVLERIFDFSEEAPVPLWRGHRMHVRFDGLA